jgi:hypothetical protein
VNVVLGAPLALDLPAWGVPAVLALEATISTAK